MTNEQLLAAPKQQLSHRDQQRQHLLQLATLQRPCPACQTPVNLIAAASITIDQYDFGATAYEFVCPNCEARLQQVVPVFGFASPWHWQLDPEWLREQLDKAKMWDEQQQKEDK